MKTFRCPYCGAALDGDAAEGHEVDCHFCRSTFVPRRKGINRSLQTVVIMAVLACIIAAVTAIAGVFSPGSAVGYLWLALGIFVVVAGLWFGGRLLYHMLVWRDSDREEESVEIRAPRRESRAPKGEQPPPAEGSQELSEDFQIPRGSGDSNARTGT